MFRKPKKTKNISGQRGSEQINREPNEKLEDTLASDLRKNLKWAVTYQETYGEGVELPAIQRFQSDIKLLREARNKERLAYVDYKRDYSINNKTYPHAENPDIDLAVNDLAKSAFAYSDSEQQLIFDWLRTRGGQANNMFIHELYRFNHFNSNNVINLGIKNSTQLYANWHLDEEGYVVFDLAQNIESVKFEDIHSGEIYYLVGQDAKHEVRLYESNVEDLELLNKLENRGLYPLMQVAGTVKLKIIDGKVEPIVTNLQAVSFTDSLQAQKDKLNAVSRDTRKTQCGKLLNIISSLKQKYSKSTTLCSHLDEIGKLLLNSNKGSDMGSVYVAVQYIERTEIIISHFMKLKPDERRPFITEFNRSKMHKEYLNRFLPGAAFALASKENFAEFYNFIQQLGLKMPDVVYHQGYDDEDITRDIGNLYVNLRIYLNRFYQHSIVEFDCSPEANNDAILSWQNSLVRGDLSKHEAFVDFRRGYALNHELFNTQTQDYHINAAIYELIKGSKFNDDRQDSDIVKRLLSDWISSKGGQANDAFLDNLLQHHVFKLQLPEQLTDRYEHVNLSIGNVTPIEMNWHHNEEGGINLSYAFDLDSITCYSDIPINPQDKPLDMIAYRPAYSGDDRVAFIDRRHGIDEDTTPLMRVEAEIELTFDPDHQRVIPKMRSLKSDLYSRALTLDRPELELKLDVDVDPEEVSENEEISSIAKNKWLK